MLPESIINNFQDAFVKICIADAESFEHDDYKEKYISLRRDVHNMLMAQAELGSYNVQDSEAVASFMGIDSDKFAKAAIKKIKKG